MRSQAKRWKLPNNALNRSITASRFRELRQSCLLSIPETAQLLQVSERTLHNWETARNRAPYSAYRLLRILRNYELPGDAWQGYTLRGDTLWSPEGLPFKAADARWWSLTVRMAHEFKHVLADNRHLKTQQRLHLQAAKSRAFTPIAPPAFLPLIPAFHDDSSSGFISSQTSFSNTSIPPVAIQQNQSLTYTHLLACNTQFMGPEWPHETTPSKAQSQGSYGLNGRGQSPSRDAGHLSECLHPSRHLRTGEAFSPFNDPEQQPEQGTSRYASAQRSTDNFAEQGGQERPLPLWQRSESETVPSGVLLSVGGVS